MEFIPKYKSKYNDVKVKKDEFGFTPKYEVKPKVRSLTKSYQSRLIKEKSKKSITKQGDNYDTKRKT